MVLPSHDTFVVSSTLWGYHENDVEFSRGATLCLLKPTPAP